MDDFKIGDRVVLTIGGPVMLVVREPTTSILGRYTECMWFDRSHRLQSSQLKVAFLLHYRRGNEHLLREAGPDHDN